MVMDENPGVCTHTSQKRKNAFLEGAQLIYRDALQRIYGGEKRQLL